MGQLSTRSIRTFVLRQGRLTEGQQKSLDLHWQRYGIELDIQQPDVSRINFDDYFDRVAPVWMEIGFGNGAALAHMAHANPAVNFVGVEVHLPGVGHAIGEIARLELQNVRLIRYDVLDLIEHFLVPDSVERLLVYFPDPWHKTRHHKRRLVNDTFLNMAAKLLKNDGLIHFATDWVPYANQVRSLVQAHEGFSCLAVNEASRAITGLRPQTHFERRGTRLGHEVNDLLLQKLG